MLGMSLTVESIVNLEVTQYPLDAILWPIVPGTPDLLLGRLASGLLRLCKMYYQ
jgi:hypothetical protein